MYVIAEVAIFVNMEAVHIPFADFLFYEKVGKFGLTHTPALGAIECRQSHSHSRPLGVLRRRLCNKLSGRVVWRL